MKAYVIITLLSICLFLSGCAVPVASPEQAYAYEPQSQAEMESAEKIYLQSPLISHGLYITFFPDEYGYFIPRNGTRFHIDTVTHLRISEDISLTNLETLSHFANVETVWWFLDFGITSDLSLLETLPKLTNLHVHNQLDPNLTFGEINIDSIKNLTSLVELHLPAARASSGDFASLGSLINLTELNMDSTQVSDINFLVDMTDLEYLQLSYNPISDITPIENLINLTYLHLRANQVSDISPLRNLNNLTWLDVGSGLHPGNYNNISDIEPLKYLINLEWLDLSSNKISNIAPLANLTNLTDLSLVGNQISDFTPLMGLTNLRTLTVDHTIDADQLEALRTALPDTLIQW